VIPNDFKLPHIRQQGIIIASSKRESASSFPAENHGRIDHYTTALRHEGKAWEFQAKDSQQIEGSMSTYSVFEI